MKCSPTWLLVTLASFVMAAAVVAEVPNVISYQGRLTTPAGTPVSDASYTVVFTIYDAVTGGTSKWTETQSVTTADGLFSASLGSVAPISDTVFSGATRYLGIKFGTDPELSPRTRLHSVPYAMCVGTVSANEMVDEPGISSNLDSGIVTPPTGSTMQDVVTTTITTPSSGYIMLITKGICVFQGTTGPNTIYAQIDETSGGTLTPPYHVAIGGNSHSSTNMEFLPLSVTRVYFKPAGSYTFRLEAKGYSSSGGTATIQDPMLTAMYFPTSYGSVGAFISADNVVDPQPSQSTANSGITSEAAKADAKSERLEQLR